MEVHSGIGVDQKKLVKDLLKIDREFQEREKRQRDLERKYDEVLLELTNLKTAHAELKNEKKSMAEEQALLYEKVNVHSSVKPLRSIRSG